MITSCGIGSLAILGSFVASNVAEEARIRGFVPLSLDRFAFTDGVLMDAWLRRYQKSGRFFHYCDNLVKHCASVFVSLK